MKIMSTGVVLGLIGSAALCGSADAQKAEELTVLSSRFLATQVGIDYTGVPVKDVALSYGIGIGDLDVSSTAGKAELNRRVLAAARAACEELDRRYPVSHPGGSTCVKATTEKSIAKISRMTASRVASLRQQPVGLSALDAKQ